MLILQGGPFSSFVKARTALLCSLFAFASLETMLAIVGALTPPTDTWGLIGLHQTVNPIFEYSVPLSAAGWIAAGLVVFQGRVSGRRFRVRSAFAKMGFGSDVFDLMMGMRGAGSRVSLLQNMETPKHRLELSELTGIDWKEVDRQLSVLEKYGLVKIHAQSGTVKLYQVTEQGKLLLKLVAELSDDRQDD
jgi:DNA-binding transcriptional ArsR family regulator